VSKFFTHVKILSQLIKSVADVPHSSRVKGFNYSLESSIKQNQTHLTQLVYGTTLYSFGIFLCGCMNITSWKEMIKEIKKLNFQSKQTRMIYFKIKICIWSKILPVNLQTYI
jgi:hypothetical protein